MLNLQLINLPGEQETEINIISVVNSHIDSINYSKFISNQDVALEAIEFEEINSNDNLEILDLSWQHPKNNINFLNQIFKVKTKSFILPYTNVLITDQYEFDIEGNEMPLFFKHKKKLKEARIEVRRSGKELEEFYGYKFVNNYFYTNYTNQYDYDTGSYVLYYIVGTDLEGNSVNELLNTEAAIKEATWEDIDLDSGEIRNNTYTKEILPEGTSFRISDDVKKECGTENNESEYFIKLVDQNLIQLLPPDEYSIKNTWNVRVSNGAFWSNGKKYFVPEFENQNFNPEFGLIKKSFKNSYLVNENVIKLASKNIRYNPVNELHLDLLIYLNEEIVEAISSDPNKIGTRYKDSEIFWENKILHVDERNGFVELNKSLELTKEIKSDYFCFVDDYLIKEINFNPTINKNIIYNKYFFYLKPNILPGFKSIEWLILDEDNIIVECSQENLKVEYNNTFNENTVINETLNTFKNLYCYNHNNDNEYLILGEVFLKEDYYLDEINHLELSFQNKININSSANRQWKLLQSEYGYGEKGQAVQKNNILYLKVPKKLLDTMSENEIDNALRRKLKAGTDIVIEYDIEESLLNITLPVVKKVFINMNWEGPGNYKLYKSDSEIGIKELIYEKESTQREIVGYVDNNVESNKKYYYWSRYNDNDFGRTYGVKVR